MDLNFLEITVRKNHLNDLLVKTIDNIILYGSKLP